MLGIKAFLSSQAEAYVEEPKIDLQTPFAPTGGICKVLAMMKLHPPSPNSIIVPQSAFVLNSLLRCTSLTPSPVVCDWNNLMKLGYDPTTSSYIDAVGRCLGSDLRRLPLGAAPGTFAGTIPSGPLQNCDVYLGSTDSICAFIGALALAPPRGSGGADGLEGLAVTSLGTTLATKVVSSRRVFDGRRGVYSHLVPSTVLLDSSAASPARNVWLAGGASQAGCAVLRDLSFTDEELSRLSATLDLTAPPTDPDLYPLPLGARGERFPFVDALAVSGVDEGKYGGSREGLLRDVLLGVAANVELEGYKAIRDMGGPLVTRVVTTGGGARNEWWTEMRGRLLKGWLEEVGLEGVGEGVVSAADEAGDAALGAAAIAYRSHRNRRGEESS